jgi:predicted RNA-binding protein YlxR (DUF448 family)
VSGGRAPTAHPLRTCIACRSVRAKHDLVRVVREATGRVRVDASRTAVGRGAYLCAVCALAGWNERALKGRLTQAFKKPCDAGTDLAEEVRALWQRRSK